MILCPQHSHGDGVHCQSSSGSTCSATSGGKTTSVNLSHLGLGGPPPSRMGFWAGSTIRFAVEVEKTANKGACNRHGCGHPAHSLECRFFTSHDIMKEQHKKQASQPRIYKIGGNAPQRETERERDRRPSSKSPARLAGCSKLKCCCEYGLTSRL